MTYPITSKFGELESFRGSSPHRGIDFAMGEGTPLYSIRNAVVERVVDFKQFSGGKMIFLKWEDGKTAVYGHLSKFANVKVGQHVQKGELIGYSGNSGAVVGENGGYHLHFAIKEGEKFLNPSPYINDIQNMSSMCLNQPTELIEKVQEIVPLKVDFFNFMSQHMNGVGETLTNLKLQLVTNLSYDVLFIQIMKNLGQLFLTHSSSFLNFIVVNIF
jgi:hypothetical protein